MEEEKIETTGSEPVVEAGETTGTETPEVENEVVPEDDPTASSEESAD